MRIRRIIKTVLLAAFVMFAASNKAGAQNVALKTSALYWATTTPNIGVEAGLGCRHTVQLFYGMNQWKASSGRSLRHWVLQPEYRYWLCETFNGWFVGAHLMGGEFNEVFAIAVRMYPDDPVANLNAACTEIERGDYDKAGRYLDKAGDNPYVWHARGAIAMKQGRLDEAERWFEKERNAAPVIQQ